MFIDTGVHVTTRYARSAAAEAAPMQDETIIFHAERNQFCVLNHTAALLWEQLASPQSPEELATGLRATYTDVTAEGAMVDVHAALRDLEALALITTVS